MATTNNVILANQLGANVTVAPPQVFNTVWSLTRAMKKAGWKYKASGDGTSKDTSSNPNADLWGNAGVSTNPGAAAASITANARGRATVTGLSGITSLDKGRFLQISGSGSGNNGYHQIEEILSSSSVKIDARAATITAPDANNGALTWVIYDPTQTTYPSALNSVAAWWCAQGPSILRIPITALPAVGPGGFTFLRGENIVQATTGFEGEIIGYVFDGASTGYLTVAPRLRGTGGGAFGLATGNAFTGSSSGATVTQNGTALEYRYEAVIVKATNTTQGLIFITQPEPVAEGATNLFSALSTAAGCTATVPPGGGGTGNTFPTLAWVALGGGTTVAAAVAWSTTSGQTPFGNTQIIAVDCIEEQNYSADGSWMWAIGCFGTVSPSGGGHKPLSFQRMDDSEDGDLSPYVTFCGSSLKTLYTNTRTSAGTVETANSPFAADTFALGIHNQMSTPRVCLNGWFRRGLINERFQEFELACLIATQSPNGVTQYLNNFNLGQSDMISTALQQTAVREPVWVVAVQTGQKVRKGTFRWIYAVGPGGGVTKFYDNKRWVQMTSAGGAMIMGPWDGSTTMLVS